jgi:hypothetical protein
VSELAQIGTHHRALETGRFFSNTSTDADERRRQSTLELDFGRFKNGNDSPGLAVVKLTLVIRNGHRPSARRRP